MTRFVPRRRTTGPSTNRRTTRRPRKRRGILERWYDTHMDPFIVRGIVSNLFFALILVACLFLPAGGWNYWQGWLFLVVFELCAQAFGVYFLINDRKAIERRVRVGPTAERAPAQKIVSALIIAIFIAASIVPAFDHRFGWSPVAPAVSILGDALVAFSFLIFFFVLKANSYAASTIQVEVGQPVISSGPYALVRHPMYSGVLVLIVAMPVALGSAFSCWFRSCRRSCGVFSTKSGCFVGIFPAMPHTRNRCAIG